MTIQDGLVSHGIATYVEFQVGGYTMQAIVTPPMVHPETRRPVAPHLLVRSISLANPQRQWRAYPGRVPTLDVTDTIAPTATFAEAVREAYDSFSDWNIHLKGLVGGGWQAVATPIAAEISTEEVDLLGRGKCPPSLTRKFMRVRSESGNYPKNLFEGGPTTDDGEDD